MPKISNFTALLSTELASLDVFPVVDISAGSSGTKKITATNLSLALQLLLADNTSHVYEGDSIQTAISAASSGQLIEVHPGTYDEQITLKDGVNLYLHKGVIISYTGATAGATISDGGISVTCSILGHGAISRSNATGTGYGFHTSHASSSIIFECDTLSSSSSHGARCTAGTQVIRATTISSSSIYGASCIAGAQTIYGNVTSSVDHGIRCDGGTQIVYGNVSSSGNGYGVVTVGGTQMIYGNISSPQKAAIFCAGGTLFVTKGRIISTKNDASLGNGVLKTGGTLILDGCTIVITNTSAYGLYATDAQTVKIYGTTVSNTAKHSNITTSIGTFIYDSTVI